MKFKIVSADRETRKITATTDLEKVIVKHTAAEKQTDIIDEFFKNEKYER